MLTGLSSGLQYFMAAALFINLIKASNDFPVLYYFLGFFIGKSLKLFTTNLINIIIAEPGLNMNLISSIYFISGWLFDFICINVKPQFENVIYVFLLGLCTLKPHLVVSILGVVVVVVGAVWKYALAGHLIKTNVSVLLIVFLTALECYFFDLFITFWQLKSLLSKYCYNKICMVPCFHF